MFNVVLLIVIVLISFNYSRMVHGLKLRAVDFMSREAIGWIDVAYQLLNRVQLPELLQDEIRLHVEPFCSSHGLQLDAVLLGYIEDIVGYYLPHYSCICRDEVDISLRCASYFVCVFS